MSILPFNIQDQLQSLWCWAAVANSISHFYMSESNWQQCTIAEKVLGIESCCPALPICNDIAELKCALQKTGNYSRHKAGTLSWNKLNDELDNGRVLGARVQEGSGGHFVVIYGASISLSKKHLHIDDPKIGIGQSFLPLADFKTRYQGTGKWTHTFFINKNGTNAV